jgi:hypothetical protein
MKRDDFLKIIGSGTGGFLLGGLGQNLSEINYEIKETVIYDNYINGVKFREEDFLKARPKENDLVTLEREAENPYDYYAVKVIVNSYFIGYLPAHENIAIANLMDAGVQMHASVSKVQLDDNDRYYQKAIAVKVSARMLAPIHTIVTDKKMEAV